MRSSIWPGTMAARTPEKRELLRFLEEARRQGREPWAVSRY
jgi:hypothetical protein